MSTTITHTTRTTQTVTQTSETIQTTDITETDAQQQEQPGRQWDGLVFVLCGVVALGAGLLTKLAPSWADPAQVTSSVGSLAAALVPYLFQRR